MNKYVSQVLPYDLIKKKFCFTFAESRDRDKIKAESRRRIRGHEHGGLA